MTIKVKITAKTASSTMTIIGLEVPFERLTLGDLTDRIAETESYLSRLTGLEVRIDTADG